MKSLPTQDRPSNSEYDAEERRTCSRFPKDPDDESAVVWRQPGREQLAAVRDESLYGIALIVRDVAEFEIGVTATIIYHAELLDGVVRRIAPWPDGRYLVAFACRRGRCVRCPEPTCANVADAPTSPHEKTRR